MVTLVDHFPWNGAATSLLATPWVPFPCPVRRAELFIDTKLADPSNVVKIGLQSTIDKTAALTIAGTFDSDNSPGLQVQEISSSLGPFVRLVLATTGTLASGVLLSVWLIPKSD